MPGERSLREFLHNLLQDGDLSFCDYVELALYHPQFGYYSKGTHPAGKGGDYVTSPSLSPAFGFALGRLVREFVRRAEGAVCSIVDIGGGDGSLINTLCADAGVEAEFFMVDRVPSPPGSGDVWRVKEDPSSALRAPSPLAEGRRVSLIISNELFDAFPFARLVQRGDELHELWVTERDGVLDWAEREAPSAYADYFASHNIELSNGQFADVSLEWEAFYDDICAHIERGLIVTFDYGFPATKLFHSRIRRFGTAAAYAQHRVTRDLLANPGEQDLTAHINFTDLERAGERRGLETLFFDRQNKFLLALGITEHELFTPVQDVVLDLELREAREEARRLVLPDGIGEEIRVLVQVKNMPRDGWSFQRELFR